MNESLIHLVTLGLGSLVFACGASRTPAEYATETDKAVAEHQSELVACYENVLKTKPDAHGDVTVQFYWNTSNTDPDARLPRKSLEVSTGKQDAEANVVADKTNAPSEITQCVTSAISQMRIRPAADGVGNATWTFHFTPRAVTTTTASNRPARRTNG